MILVTGGAFQGKREFARTLKPNATEADVKLLEQGSLIVESMEHNSPQDTVLIADFHLYIKKLLQNEKDVQQEVKQLLCKYPEVIITVTELGCGIVPAEAFDRKYRETVGRICCEIAKEAEAVYRVNCGVGMKIK